MTDFTLDFQFSNDQPIMSRVQDILGRETFAASIATSIKRWAGKESLVMAMYGSGGSGKTSTMNMVVENLQDLPEESPYIFEFNPWQWLNQKSLLESFFHEAGAFLNEIDTSKDGKKRVELWNLYYAHLKGISGVDNHVSSPRTKKVPSPLTSTSNSKTLAELKLELSNSLRKLKLPILIIMDDIERLPSSEILILFQILKIDANFPGILYFALMQRDGVEENLRKTDLGTKCRELLDKVVQVTFDIPRVEPIRLERYFFNELQEVVNGQVILKRFNMERWSKIYMDGLFPYFETLRDVHRFISALSFQVALFYNQDSFEVNPIDLVSLEVLRIFEPEVYHRIPELKYVLTGRRDYEHSIPQVRDRIKQMVLSIVGRAAERHRQHVQEIIKELFPPAGWIFSGTSSGMEFHDEWYRDLRICHYDVFDRYFIYSIPEGDISQHDIDKIVSLANNREGLVSYFKELNEQGLLGVILDRLEAYKQELNMEYALPFITALLDIGDALPEEPTGIFNTGPDMHASRIIHFYLLREEDPEVRAIILKEAMKTTTGLYLPVMKTSVEDGRDERLKKQALHFSDKDLKDFKEICIQKIRDAAADGRLQNHPKMEYILYRWWNWASPEEPQKWVQKLMQTKEGIVSFLTAFLQKQTSYGAETYRMQIHRFMNLKSIENFVPIDSIAGIIEDIKEEELSKEEQIALHTFAKTMKWRQEGKPDDYWKDEIER